MSEHWLISIFSVVSGIIVTLQIWILLRMIDHEKQIFRLVSDRESEKFTISRVHSDFETRIRFLEHRPL